MLLPSSPITFPQSSSPPTRRKRDGPHDGRPPAKPVTRGGFLVEEDSDDDGGLAEPPSKKQMVDRPENSTSLDEGPDGEAAPAPTDEASQEIPDAQLVFESQQAGETQTDLFFNPTSYPSLLGSWKAQEAAATPQSVATCSGRSIPIRQRAVKAPVPYESMVAARSRTKEGRAKRSYYGVDIHALMDGAEQEIAAASAAKKAQARASASTTPDVAMPSVEALDANTKKPKKCLLWTEKYRARSFMDLVGDDFTHRQVLRWLKRWDPVVFPNSANARTAAVRRPAGSQQQSQDEKPHRKILMLTGPPGLGKTTLAHVCARQAGYEVLEINASDDRSKDVVRGRIRTTLGTESVKTVEHAKAQPGKQQKVARPLCVVVDEVDGVVSGAGASGEGGFVKALIDLVLTDQKNASEGESSTATGRRKKKGDDFRQKRPLVLICNDVYHTSLRPLRQSGLAEIIHVGKPSIDAVVTRLKTVFEKEGIPCEKDAARKLCEAAWGMTSGIDARRGAESTAEGDLRGVMVVGEWVARRFRAAASGANRQLTRQWIEQNVLRDLAHGGGGARGIGRGGVKEIATRVFQEGAGFPRQAVAATQSKKTRHEQPKTQLTFSEHQKRYGMARLGEMIETSGEVDRVMTEVFLEYPNREYNDDCYLTKPNTAYEWMHFHDTCSHRVYASQEWELGQYFSQPVLACHHLFASAHRHVPNAGYDRKWGMDAEEEAAQQPLPFSGPRADFAAREAEKENRALLQTIQAQLPPSLMRAFRSPEDISTDFMPYLVRLVSPDVKPILVGGSDKGSSIASVRREGEKVMVRRAAEVLAEVGISLLKGKIEEANPSPASRTQWVYRMEPSVTPLRRRSGGQC